MDETKLRAACSRLWDQFVEWVAEANATIDEPYDQWPQEPSGILDIILIDIFHEAEKRGAALEDIAIILRDLTHRNEGRLTIKRFVDRCKLLESYRQEGALTDE
jgi:hypothetical protein